MNPFSLGRSQRMAAFAFLLLTGGAFRVTNAADATDFASGNQRYAAGDYAGAVRAYESRVQQGWYSANLFSNLGDAYYRLGDKGRAVLNYRRALLLEPSQAEAAANLSFTSGRPGKTRNAFAWVWAAAPWAAAACGWLGAAGLLVAAAYRRRRAAGFGWAIGGFALCAGVAGLIWSFDGNAENSAVAVVVAEATPALYSPADTAKVVTTLPAGAEVRILSEQGAWIYALLGDGTTRAWLSASKVEPLVPR